MINQIKKQHIVKTLLVVVSIISLGGCLIEDFFNAREITTPTNILTLKELNETSNDSITIQQHSIKVKTYTRYIEYYDQLPKLRIDTYMMNKEDTEIAYQEILNHPTLYKCDTFKESVKGILYGYSNDELNTIVFKKENQIIQVTTAFKITNEMKAVIENHYK